MERHEIIFSIHHNENLEKYQRTFWSRVNNLVTFAQIFLGTAVFSGIAGTQWYGALIAALTIGTFVWRPESKASDAEKQIEAYINLRIHYDDWDDERLKTEFKKITANDSDVFGLFFEPAYNRAAIQTNCPDAFGAMNFSEKFFSWFGGDLPVKPQTGSE